MLATAISMVTAQASEPIVIRFSHVVAEDTPKGKGALMFKRLAEERLGQRVKVEIYPRSVKFNDDQALLGLLLGDVELAAPSFSKFRAYSAKVQLFDLPFLFDDMAAVRRFQASEAGRSLLDAIGPRGLKGLAYWDNGARVMSANRPVRTPEDIKGLRFRIEPSRVMEAQYRALGVATVPMPFKHVAEALKAGLVTGQENAWSNIYSKGFHRYQRYFTEVGHTFLGYMLVTSTDFWNSLPPDVRSELDRVIAEVTVEVNRIAQEKAEHDRQAVADAGTSKILTLTAGERARWREVLTPIWRKFDEQIGAELIEAAQAANRP